MSNYPLNYTGTKPPYDNPEADMFENIVYDAVSRTRSLIAGELPQLLLELSREAVNDQAVPGGWEDWKQDNQFELSDAVYDELRDEISKLWEHDV